MWGLESSRKGLLHGFGAWTSDRGSCVQRPRAGLTYRSRTAVLEGWRISVPEWREGVNVIPFPDPMLSVAELWRAPEEHRVSDAGCPCDQLSSLPPLMDSSLST